MACFEEVVSMFLAACSIEEKFCKAADVIDDVFAEVECEGA